MIISPKHQHPIIPSVKFPWASMLLCMAAVVTMVWAFTAYTLAPMPLEKVPAVNMETVVSSTPSTAPAPQPSETEIKSQADFEMRRDYPAVLDEQRQHTQEEYRENADLPPEERSPLAPIQAPPSATLITSKLNQ